MNKTAILKQLESRKKMLVEYLTQLGSGKNSAGKNCGEKTR